MLQLPDDWKAELSSELEHPYAQALARFVREERERATVFPSAEHTFRALELTVPADVRVVLLGQDPYHGAGQANGLSFSVSRGVKIPPSLRNIYKELHADLGCDLPKHGDLSAWAAQGVLLLNAVLTVREGEPASHKNRGWERLTDAMIRALAARKNPIVFVLWGAYAKRKARLVSGAQHQVLEGVHPSPLSASRGFMGSRPFSTINELLEDVGQAPILWSLSDGPKT